MAVPTRGETYAKLMEHLRQAEEAAAMMAHLFHAEADDRRMALQWLAISEGFKKMQHSVTQLAMGRMQ